VTCCEVISANTAHIFRDKHFWGAGKPFVTLARSVLKVFYPAVEAQVVTVYREKDAPYVARDAVGTRKERGSA